MSRYSASRYDGEARRSRSRERSLDRYNERGSQYSDGGPRRSSAESRSNSSAFQTNRDSFRDPLPRDTPRGPRALLDPPSGPRGGGLSGDFRGRGRGRGRGWRDDSRDRGRDRDIDFRDRRDAPYRDDRSRERDWRDRERDGFRGRRPSPRGRSPPFSRDFRDPRDLRDPPLGVDADIARRGSRDPPLSAGPSPSEPPFGPSYRGGFGGRGRGRGRGDWDRGRGRPFYDDRERDRYGPGLRARSQEARFRERDDRDRDNRFFDHDARPRDLRDDRDAREREVRARVERTSHEPPAPARDVTPPPVAPAAPSFGSVPSRAPSVSDISSVTGRAPPTGPRALDRPPPTAPASNSDTRGPPSGPSRPPFPESAPSIPSGPRGPHQFPHSHPHQRPGPSSKQWINPNLKRGPESPKINRSQSFAQPRAAPRTESAALDQQAEKDRRPRSSDAMADSRLPSTEEHLHESLTVASGGDTRAPEKEPRPAEPLLDKTVSETSQQPETPDHLENKAEEALAGMPSSTSESIHPVADAGTNEKHRETILQLPAAHLSLPQKAPKAPIIDQSSESDDEDDIGDVIDTQLAETESRLKKLEALEDAVPTEAIVRHVIVSLETANKVVTEPEGLEAMVGPVPKSISASLRTADDVEKQAQVEEAEVGEVIAKARNVTLEEKLTEPIAAKVPLDVSTLNTELPHPSIEHDIDMMHVDEPVVTDMTSKSVELDVVMKDAAEPGGRDQKLQQGFETTTTAISSSSRKSSLYPGEEPALSDDRSKEGTSTPSAVEDDDETEIEDVDLPSADVVRVYGPTPPLDGLPDFDEKPWYSDKAFLRSMDAPDLDVQRFVMDRLKDEHLQQDAEEQKLKKLYTGDYEAYLRFTMSDDPIAIKNREKFDLFSGVMDTQKGSNGDTKHEPTRRSRYASERDLERILEESRKAEQEKRERQLRAEQEKHRNDAKEAIPPCQYLTEEERRDDMFTDTTGFLEPEKVVAAWEVLPSVDNFTEDEVAQFEKAYLEFPKQWGKIADHIPNRDFGAVIQFYYMKKNELKLKEKLKKRPKPRKNRRKHRSSALTSELGNGDHEHEENHETENGERSRRPRRAAAPTFNSEATPATDGENGTGTSTPSRRGHRGDHGEKPERKRRGRQAKDKEPKHPRANQALAAAPATASKASRSRSSSHVQTAEWQASQTAQQDLSRLQPQYEIPPGGVTAPVGAIQPPFSSTKPLVNPDHQPPLPGSISDVMAPPPLRPEPPQSTGVGSFEINQPSVSDRKVTSQASSYWSVPEASDFPELLRSFGSDWSAIANHMKTKTAVMAKNYYMRQKDAKDWEAVVREADEKKMKGEKLPVPPTPNPSVKKRYDTSSMNRVAVSADTVMKDLGPTKLEQPPTAQSLTGCFNVPIAAQPPSALVHTPFTQAAQSPQAAALVQAQQPRVPPQSAAQPVAQTLSPSARPLQPPFGFNEREREPALQQSNRSPQKPSAQTPSAPNGDPLSIRHPLPGSFVDTQIERQKIEAKAKEQAQQLERPPLRVKQEPDLVHPYEPYPLQPQATRGMPARPEPLPAARSLETARPFESSFQSPLTSVLHQQPGRGLLSDMNPSPSAPPRPLSTLSRPLSGERFGTPPTQPALATPAPAPPRPAEPRKTSSIMSLLNEEPTPPPKRVAEMPAMSSMTSSTPPPQSNLSRPPPGPPPPTQSYGPYGRNPPPAPSSMPSLKPYATASPQPPPLSAPRVMGIDPADRELFGRQRQFSSPHQPAANSPQTAHLYAPQARTPPLPYPNHSTYPYGVQPQPPAASSPPPQYGGYSSAPRETARELSWPGSQSAHLMQQQQQQQQQQQSPWQSQPPKPPQPTQSPWAAQHASAPKPPAPSGAIPPQPSWAAQRDPREAMSLRDASLRDTPSLYSSPRIMQPPIQNQYAPPPRAAEPPAGPYARYNTPVQGRDPREPPRSYTPVGAYEARLSYAPPGQDLREAQLREQQQQQQQLRPQDRNLYDARHPPDRYGR